MDSKPQTSIDAASHDGAAAELLPGAISGDRRARDTLARWCLPRIRRTVVLTYGNGPDRDDLVQIALIKVFSGLSGFRGDAGFYIWVDRITVNTVRDHFRGRRYPLLWRHELDEAMNEPRSADRPDEQFERSRLLARLSEHFAALKPKYRLPLVLTMAHGHTLPEVAAIMNLGFHTAKKRIQRGRRALLRRIKHDPYCQAMLKEMDR